MFFDIDNMTKSTKDIFINFTLVFSIIGGFNFLIYKYFTKSDNENDHNSQTELKNNSQTELENKSENNKSNEIDNNINIMELDINTNNQLKINQNDILDKKEKLILLYNKLIEISSLLQSLKNKVNKN